MANYLLVYKDGTPAATEADGEKEMQAWMGWFGTLGDAVVDGGNPTSDAKTISPGGAVSNGGSGITGYSVLKADSLDAAMNLAKGCPLLASGGAVEVYETFNVG